MGSGGMRNTDLFFFFSWFQMVSSENNLSSPYNRVTSLPQPIAKKDASPKSMDHLTLQENLEIQCIHIFLTLTLLEILVFQYCMCQMQSIQSTQVSHRFLSSIAHSRVLLYYENARILSKMSVSNIKQQIQLT